MCKMKISFFPCFLSALLSMNVSAADQIQGIGIHANKYSKSAESILGLIKQSGFDSFRQDLTWNDIEVIKNHYSIPKKLEINDTLIKTAESHNISPLVILDYGNRNYNNGGYPTSAQDIKAFADYAKWVAARYKGKVPYYEVWNEWTVGTGMKGKGDIPPSDVYLQLVKATSIAIKSVDPTAKVLAGSLNPISTNGRRLNISDTVWFNQLIKEGILNYIDGISIHPYSFLNPDKSLRNPELNIQKIDDFYNKIKPKNNKDIPIYITEMGVSTHAGLGGVSQEQAADFIVKYTILAKSKPYIKGVWWYDLRDDGTDSDNQEHNFGFYDNSFNPKQAALAFTNMHNTLKNMIIDGVSVNTNNNTRQVTVSLKDTASNKNYKINWNENQLEQNGRLKSINLMKKNNSSTPVIYDKNNLSGDVFLK
ncbi:MAG: cellulase family glycosylhydrolase [Ewingella sp.]